MATGLLIAATALSTGMGVFSSIQQGRAQAAQMQAQAAQAQYQAEIARQNQELAKEQASAERKQGYDNMITQRQETAKLIGRQRAAAGASGATVDVGSNLDLQADTAAQGEIDAITAYNQGLDRAYNREIEAWNYGNQATAFDTQASNARSSASNALNAGYLNAASSAIGGIAQMGSTWASANPAGKTTRWDTVQGNSISMRHPSGKWSRPVKW